jgi:hypothetical protein
VLILFDVQEENLQFLLCRDAILILMLCLFLGAEEYKLFVSNVNTQAKENEVEEIFARYGRVENVSIIRDGLT